MYPFRSSLLRVIELDHKISELYCYKHSSEIKYFTLFWPGVFSFHHFVVIWWFLFWRSSVIYLSNENWLIANCFMVGGYKHKCVVLWISIGLRSVALAAEKQPESSWASHKFSSCPLSCLSRRSGHTPHHYIYSVVIFFSWLWNRSASVNQTNCLQNQAWPDLAGAATTALLPSPIPLTSRPPRVQISASSNEQCSHDGTASSHAFIWHK
jgi:hypothetical protein